MLDSHCFSADSEAVAQLAFETTTPGNPRHRGRTRLLSIPLAAEFGESGQFLALAPDAPRLTQRRQTMGGLVVAQIGLDRFVQ